jgi:hypothetical protein
VDPENFILKRGNTVNKNTDLMRSHYKLNGHLRVIELNRKYFFRQQIKFKNKSLKEVRSFTFTLEAVNTLGAFGVGAVIWWAQRLDLRVVDAGEMWCFHFERIHVFTDNILLPLVHISSFVCVGVAGGTGRGRVAMGYFLGGVLADCFAHAFGQADLGVSCGQEDWESNASLN